MTPKGPGAKLHEMTDREMEGQCARGMGVAFTDDYRPLKDDAQADLLAAKFNVTVAPDTYFPDQIRATLNDPSVIRYATKHTRNRAIVTVVANFMWGRP